MIRILQYTKDLKNHNNRDWFNENKKRYNVAKDLFLSETQDIINRLQIKDLRLVELQAKDCMFRIFRDIRFSSDKTPYKTHFSAYIAKWGRKSNEAGYYVQLSNEGCFIGGGVYSPQKEELNVIRQEILYQADTFTTIIDNKVLEGFRLYAEDKLKTGPKGFPKDSPHIELLKNKHFFLSLDIPEIEVLSGNFSAIVSSHLEQLLPFTDYLNTAMEFKSNE